MADDSSCGSLPGRGPAATPHPDLSVQGDPQLQYLGGGALKAPPAGGPPASTHQSPLNSAMFANSRLANTALRLHQGPLSASGKRLSDYYKVGATLGKGSFAVVKEAQRMDTGKRFAVKMIELANPSFDLDALCKEIDTMQRIDHPNCIHLHDIFVEEKYICLVMDLVTGGELFDRIISRGRYSEKDAAEVTKEILLAVKHLHDRGIVHRDLKPENLLYMSNDESQADYKHIMVADFGLARCCGPGMPPMRTTCGTPGYVAPEVLDPRLRGPNGYGAESDIWSIGVVVYILLCGFPPFYSENTITLFRQIRRGDYSFPSPYWDNISHNAKDLVRRLLLVDPKKRLTAQQCLQHPWIVNASLQEDKELGSQHRAFLLIRRLPLFEQVDPICLSEVTVRLKRVIVKANDYVIKSGDEGRCMYFVGSTPNDTIGNDMQGDPSASQRSKCLSVIVDGHEVTFLGTGDYFGEVALVSRSDHKRTADVKALCSCELFELSREDMMKIIKNFPILEARLQCMAEARLKRAQCSSVSGSCDSITATGSFGSFGQKQQSPATANSVEQQAPATSVTRAAASAHQQQEQHQHKQFVFDQQGMSALPGGAIYSQPPVSSAIRQEMGGQAMGAHALGPGMPMAIGAHRGGVYGGGHMGIGQVGAVYAGQQVPSQRPAAWGMGKMGGMGGVAVPLAAAHPQQQHYSLYASGVAPEVHAGSLGGIGGAGVTAGISGGGLGGHGGGVGAGTAAAEWSPSFSPIDFDAQVPVMAAAHQQQAHQGLQDISNPADLALRHIHLYSRQPSKRYLACPEAVPRVHGFLRMNSKLGIVVAENLVMDNTKASTPQGKPESNMDGGASELSPLFCPAAPHVGQGTSHLFQPLALSKGGVAGNGAALKPIIPPVGSRWDDPPVRAKKRTKSGLPE